MSTNQSFEDQDRPKRRSGRRRDDSSRILSDVQLKRLKEHRYNCCSNSLLDPYLQPYWNWLVLQIPLWLAPNLITMVGLAVNVATTFVLIYYSPDCKQLVPPWASLLCAFGLFAYQSLDAIDGKQARRTKTSSPLGELFDHGCDSISTVFVSLGVCVACRLGSSLPFMFLQCVLAITLYYCAHWQTYVSGTLRFGRIDVTEAQIGIIIIHILTAIFGGEFWTMSEIFWHPVGTAPILLALPFGLWSIFKTIKVIFTGGIGKNGSTVAFIPNVDVPFYYIYVVVALSGAIPALYSEFRTILYQGAGKNGSSIAGTSVLSPVIPFTLVILPAVLIAWRSEQNIYGTNPALYILTFGLVAAKITNRLVVAHMTKSEMEYLDMSLLGPFILFMNQYFNCVLQEHYLLWLSLILVTIELVRYSKKVCIEICESLNIYLFSIDVSELTLTTNKKLETEKPPEIEVFSVIGGANGITKSVRSAFRK